MTDETAPQDLVKRVGFWRETLARDDNDWQGNYPHPRLLQCPGWAPSDKQAILAYLRTGNVCAECMGYSFCRFEDGPLEMDMGSRDLTDGVWVWPEGLAIYVERYDVRLPEEFIATMRANRFCVPHLDREAAERRTEAQDATFWIQWGRDNEACY